jgi:DNA-binding response OmpR family regulator
MFYMMRNKILLLEDDLMIAGGLVYALEQEQYDVVHTKTIEEAKTMIKSVTFDLAILDMQLPDGVGTVVQESLKGSETEIIFLTVVDDEGNIVKAFEEGAADYITKPFRLRELLARVKRILLTVTSSITSYIQIGNVKIDTDAAKVFIDGVRIDLTALEYKLLLIFATNKGRIMTREQILDNLWDASGNFVEDNTLTVYIKRLRGKLRDAVDIKTVRGMGYRVD